MYDFNTSEKKAEFRRGTSQTEITSICFSSDNSFLGVASDTGTGHIFKLASQSHENSQMFGLQSVLPGQRDFAHLKIKGDSKVSAIYPKPYF